MLLPAKEIATGKVKLIRVEDILYFHREQDKVVIHTIDKVYTPLKSLNDYYQLLQAYGFDKLDKSNIVNLKQITTYDSNRRCAQFRKGRSVKKVSVSRRNAFKIKRLKTVRKL
ncbi:putative response regulator [Bacillus sp. TS-2]|nr:putative response regulator [Bacillus sp. TS-2]